MSGLFSQCCECSPASPAPDAACQWTIVRSVFCFPEYEATHTTTNPVTYFLGRFYRQADFVATIAGGDCGDCIGSWSGTSSLTEFIGAPNGDNSDCTPGTAGSGPMNFTQNGYNDCANWIPCINTATSCVIGATSISTEGTSFVGATYSGASNLSIEVDYDAVADTIRAQIVAAQAYTTANPVNETGLPGGCINYIWGFNDAPNPMGGDLLSDYSAYDGSIDISTPGSGRLCSLSWPGTPSAPHGYGVAQWILDGTCGAPGCVMTAQVAWEVTLPYILATFFIMNDGTFVLDTDHPCIDGTSSTNFWPPVPSLTDFPSDMFSTEDGFLTGPIGRIIVVIPSMTCADYDGTFPT